MQWKNYVALVTKSDGQTSKPFIVRAVSVKHASTKVERMVPDFKSYEVEQCRCSEINNDMCSAHYLYHFNQ